MNDQFFIEVAKSAAMQSTCLRRKFGCVIVNPETKFIVSTGYNGVPRNKEHCTDREWCIRKSLNIPRGERYEACLSIHSEQNALLQAGKNAYGCDMYIVGFESDTMIPITFPKPCFLCNKMAINSGINNCFIWSGRNIVNIDLNELYEHYVMELSKLIKDD